MPVFCRGRCTKAQPCAMEPQLGCSGINFSCVLMNDGRREITPKQNRSAGEGNRSCFQIALGEGMQALPLSPGCPLGFPLSFCPTLVSLPLAWQQGKRPPQCCTQHEFRGPFCCAGGVISRDRANILCVCSSHFFFNLKTKILYVWKQSKPLHSI